jgi:hypothetical protein
VQLKNRLKKMESWVEIYRESNGQTQIKVKFDQDTVWLSQRQMAELFCKDSDTIGLDLKNVYEDIELQQESTTEYFPVVQQEGKRKVRRKIKFYNLDAIIRVVFICRTAANEKAALSKTVSRFWTIPLLSVFNFAHFASRRFKLSCFF